MSTLPEQFSAVRKAQLDAQIQFFQNFSARSLESVQQLVALNLTTSRASMEKSAAAVAQLLSVKDPRDLFSLTNSTQESFNGALAYSRAFMAIATGTGAALAEAVVKTVPEPKTPALALVSAAEPAPTEPAPTEPASPEPVAAVVAPVAELVAPVAEPEALIEATVVASAAPVAPPDAEAKPIAKAVNKVVKSAATQPVSAPVPAAKPVVVTGIKPVDAAPPPAPVSGKPTLEQQQLDLPAAKSKKKK